jgi:3D (Asp-Asp-Asp) domain-containing protein
MARTPAGHGYWLVAADGGVFAFGDARYLGGLPRSPFRLVVGMAATRSGRGYWLVAADGGVYAFGDATFAGSAATGPLNQPIVGIAATRSGRGYWLVARDGGVFDFGDARYFGSEAGRPLAAPVVAMAATGDGRGYWLQSADGGVFAFGSAPFTGALRVDPAMTPATTLAGTPDGRGYWEAVSPAPRVMLGTFVATCYTGGGRTATGTPTSLAVIAVDPGVIPLGAHVFIPGIGVRTAADTGGAIRGARVDIWQPSLAQCVQFGVQPVAVYRLP